MKKSEIEKENHKKEIALFKYGVIAPLINDAHDCKSKEEFYRNAANKKYIFPNGSETVVTPRTIKRWYIEYSRSGLDALQPQCRSDAGLFRKIPIEIDDASRLIVGYQFFLRDNAINFQQVLKQAIKTYGIPKRLFVDNGTPYKNQQLKLICASIGTALIYARVYSPESKAKIEKAFRTVYVHRRKKM